MPHPTGRLQFGPFTFDPGSHQLIRGGDAIHLAPKSSEVLLLFAQNAGRVLPKDEIIRDIWPDVAVEEGNLTQQISLLRKALGAAPDGSDYIETIPKAGYRFLVQVTPAPSPGDPVTSRRGTWRFFLTIAAVLLLWAVVFYWLGRRSAVPPPSPHQTSSFDDPQSGFEKIQRLF